MVFSDMQGEPLYANFVKSPQYAEWRAYLAAKKKPAAAKATPKKPAAAAEVRKESP